MVFNGNGVFFLPGNLAFCNDYTGTDGVHIGDREVELSRAVCEHCRIIFKVSE